MLAMKFLQHNSHKLLAVLVLFVVLSNQIAYVYYGGLQVNMFLWFCDLMSYVLAYALWSKNKFLVSTVFLSAVPAQFMWIVDFFLNLFGASFGRTSWMFTNTDTWILSYTSTIMHALLIPASLYGVYKFGFEKRSIFGVYVIILTLLPASYFFTDPAINTNCAFYPCDLSFFKDKELILSNDLYMSKLYLAKIILEWFVYTSLFYIAVIFTQKYIKRYTKIIMTQLQK